LQHLQLMAERQDLKVQAARDGSTPLRVARTEISTDIIADTSVPVRTGKFNGFNTPLPDGVLHPGTVVAGGRCFIGGREEPVAEPQWRG
jgi:hypothetical protein